MSSAPQLGKAVLMSVVLFLVVSCGASELNSNASQNPSSTGGNGPETSQSCELYVPQVLPDGSVPGNETQEFTADRYEWALADGSMVTVVVGEEAMSGFSTMEEFSSAFEEESDQVVIGPDGERRLVMPVGDWHVGTVSIQFISNGCATAVYLPDGTSEAEAKEYAGRA